MAMDPFDSSPANAFTVTIDGIEIPKVVEVSGLKTEVDKIELKQQTKDGKYIVRQLIGRPKAGQFTVTRGLTDSKTVTDWLKVVMEGDVAGARKTASVALLDYKGETIKTYNFVNCWVQSVELNSLKAGATEQATEKFTVCYDESSVA
ncbi:MULTISPECIES: phage tail protein [Microbacterium]|uniref:Phage tail protein n=1 Tax=Microbacterium wangchenii TaxID=2541726 RepID=A0ABX5SSQ6_9MICO|nr:MULTISPECIES: phage tail protein [Microbacterium]MCK6067917.1 phage tail protein [Microbacterium sp. EYE_512]QBR89198.1 phage tail protein [Microbacterium wangchenii]TFV81747.1 phage tail protein [Microbacterium sp. dk485]TXK10868.1 phage tail protein [Microbacterium wangchenii]